MKSPLLRGATFKINGVTFKITRAWHLKDSALYDITNMLTGEVKKDQPSQIIDQRIESLLQANKIEFLSLGEGLK